MKVQVVLTINLVSNNHGLTKIHVVWAYPLVSYKLSIIPANQLSKTGSKFSFMILLHFVYLRFSRQDLVVKFCRNFCGKINELRKEGR